MLSPFHKIDAKEIAAKKLTISKALELVAFLRRPNLPFVRFIRCEKANQAEVEAVVFEVDVELGQRKIHDIREVEPIGVVFDPEDKIAPQVLALREDFPVTPHQNSRQIAPPRWLCLDEEPYSEQKLRWSVLSFIERIREWLRLTAVDKLHDEDQPLEQLLATTPGTIILPHDFEKRFKADNPAIVWLELLNNSTEKQVLRVNTNNPAPGNTKPRIIPAVFTTSAIQHGVIDEQPTNLLELHEFCQKAKFDLFDALGVRLRDWIGRGSVDFRNDRLVIIIVFPKKRHANVSAEQSDVWVFFPGNIIKQISIALGVQAEKNGIISLTINFGQKKSIADPALAEKIDILPLRPVFTLNRTKAALFNGFNSSVEKRVTAVGMGAIGSQIFNNMLRSGFGEWALVDKDFLLPHNCARHVLFGNSAGYNKTDSLAWLADTTIESGSPTISIPADVFNPDSRKDELSKAFEAADFIFDFSASVSVARYLGIDVASKARRVSVFLNPSGTDSVILMEDVARKCPLTWLEMEYYRLLANNDSLSGHLSDDGGRIRYARSCGDISSRINQNLVALHAAIGSQTLRKSLEQNNASITIFRANPDTFEVQKFAFELPQFRAKKVSNWTVFVSKLVLSKVHDLRRQHLPNETGGVLVGYFDRQHHAIYIVDALPAPQDSIERPILFIRGVRGLQKEINRIKKTTMSHLEYVGEWHSHPPRCSPELSGIDRRELRTLTEEMSAANLPALMLIVADRNRQEFFLG